MPAVGIDVNPAAFQIASLYRFANIDKAAREQHFAALETALVPLMHAALPLPASGQQQPPIRNPLLSVRQAQTDELRKILLDALIIFMAFVKDGTSKAFVSVWQSLKNIIRSLPESEFAIDMVNGDARQIPLPDGCVDLVLTSPPYINVFNYHQHYRVSTETLGWDVLSVARSEIGSNRKHRSNRFLTVTQYCLDLMQVLIELARVCKTDGRIIFVVGRESTVRGISIANGSIVADLAARSGCLRLVMRQERVFKNRFGTMIYEDILHMKPTGHPCVADPLSEARHTATIALTAALVASSAGPVREDAVQALAQVNAVQPSPMYRPNAEAL